MNALMQHGQTAMQAAMGENPQLAQIAAGGH